MMKIFTSTISVLLLCSLSFISCKKDKSTQVENPISGTWEETELNGIRRLLSFTNDNDFSFITTYGEGESTAFIGNYRVEEEKLSITATEMLEQEPGKTVKRTTGNYPLYEKAIFSIAGDTLRLNYISYPADAPVNTHVKFHRIN